MARAKEVLFYRREYGQDVWQFGRFRPGGMRRMKQQGWREITWMWEGLNHG